MVAGLVPPRAAPRPLASSSAATCGIGVISRERSGWVVRGAWCVMRNSWCVVRGAWCVVRGAWCVVRGAWGAWGHLRPQCL
eukprot:scaffold107710_cov33-Phaeocystis_antarctica.AAC.1